MSRQALQTDLETGNSNGQHLVDDLEANAVKSEANFVELYSGQSRPTITGLTGGTSSDLDSIATVGVAAGLLQVVFSGGEFSVWGLTAGTDAEDAAGGYVRPDDYATTTNEKVWVQAL